MNWFTLLTQMLVVMIGGAVGAAIRFLVGVAVGYLKWEGFPWATLLVNIVGCFLIGLMFVASQKELPQLTKLGLSIGFLGALTTFSTFSLDTLLLWRNGHLVAAISYAMGSLFLGLLAVAMGQVVGQWWLDPVS